MAEEPPALDTAGLQSLEVWGHRHPNILLRSGRCSHLPAASMVWPREGMTDEEKDEYVAKLAEEDKVEDRFKALNEDVAMPGMPAGE